MAFGLAIVASNFEHIAEILDFGNARMSAKLGDQAAMVKPLIVLATNSRRR